MAEVSGAGHGGGPDRASFPQHDFQQSARGGPHPSGGFLRPGRLLPALCGGFPPPVRKHGQQAAVPARPGQGRRAPVTGAQAGGGPGSPGSRGQGTAEGSPVLQRRRTGARHCRRELRVRQSGRPGREDRSGPGADQPASDRAEKPRHHRNPHQRKERAALVCFQQRQTASPARKRRKAPDPLPMAAPAAVSLLYRGKVP